MTSAKAVAGDPAPAAPTPQEVGKHMFAADRASQGLGMRILALGAGSARLEMAVRDDMLNGHEICHGGFITTLADSAFAFACNSRNQLTVAAGLTVDFLAPVQRGDVLTADASRGRAQRPHAASTTSSSPTAPARASPSSAAARRGSASAP